MAKKKEAWKHLMGKQTGYEVRGDEIRIAPLYRDQFQHLFHEEQGINKMLAVVTKHAASDLEIISKKQKQTWDEIADDLGIDTSESWVYRYNGTISKPKGVRSDAG